jgi:hypothetical protein
MGAHATAAAAAVLLVATCVAAAAAAPLQQHEPGRISGACPALASPSSIPNWSAKSHGSPPPELCTPAERPPPPSPSPSPCPLPEIQIWPQCRPRSVPELIALPVPPPARQPMPRPVSRARCRAASPFCLVCTQSLGIGVGSLFCFWDRAAVAGWLSLTVAACVRLSRPVTQRVAAASHQLYA